MIFQGLDDWWALPYTHRHRVFGLRFHARMWAIVFETYYMWMLWPFHRSVTNTRDNFNFSARLKYRCKAIRPQPKFRIREMRGVPKFNLRHYLVVKYTYVVMFLVQSKRNRISKWLINCMQIPFQTTFNAS